MSMHSFAIVFGFLGGVFGFALATAASAAEGPNLGEPISEADIAPWDITIMPDGTGLPAGSGTAALGAPIARRPAPMAFDVGPVWLVVHMEDVNSLRRLEPDMAAHRDRFGRQGLHAQKARQHGQIVGSCFDVELRPGGVWKRTQMTADLGLQGADACLDVLDGVTVRQYVQMPVHLEGLDGPSRHVGQGTDSRQVRAGRL